MKNEQICKADSIVEDDRWLDVTPPPGAIAEACRSAAAVEIGRADGEVAILFTNDDTMRRLNTAFRQKDAPTNVLSFPSGDPSGRFIGDIAVGFETCSREAEAEGKTLSDHAHHMIVHGLLHLVGFNHETDEDADMMERLEIRILDALGVSDPYAADDAAPKSGPKSGMDDCE